MANTSPDPSTYPAGTMPTGSEELLVNQSGSLVYLTALQLTQFSYSTVGLWKTYDTVAQMKAGASATYPRVKWRGYNYVGDGGGGEGIYVTGTYTADEGTVFATTAGGYVLRDIPHGDVKTTWFGMSAVSGPAGTPLNPTTTGGASNPSTDFSAALQAASNFAAAAGRALHVVGRLGSYLLGSPVTFAGVRRIYGDGQKLDAKFGTHLNWAPSKITDLAAGIVLADDGQIFEKITVTSTDANYTNVTSATLISGGQLTVPSGFVWHRDVMPYTAFAAGLAAITVNAKCILRDVDTAGGKFGVLVNGATGHVVFENCSVSGGIAGRFWIQDGQDYLILEGGSSGSFCCELMAEPGFAGSVWRYHQYHNPVGWYQCNYANTGRYSGMYLDGHQLSIEALSEAWIMMAPSAGVRINVVSGGDFGAKAPGTSAYELSTKLPDSLFANSAHLYYCMGRLGNILYFNLNGFQNQTITPQGGTGTYVMGLTSYPVDMAGSDFTYFNPAYIDTTYLTGNTAGMSNVAFMRNVDVLSDKSDPATKTQAPRAGNLTRYPNAYSASLGLGVANNCTAANGGAWTVSSGNSSYPGSIKMDTWQNWVTNGVALVIPENVSRMVGPNPMIMEITNTGVSGVSANVSVYHYFPANNISDGQQGLYLSVYTAGPVGIFVNASDGLGYNTAGGNVTGALTFSASMCSGVVHAKGVTIQRIGFNVNNVGTKAYIMCPMVNFGALSEFNAQPHPMSESPMYLSSGLRQAGRAFVTTTASGGATTAVTIADFLVEVNATAAAATVTLPAAPFDGEVHVIKKADTSANAVTVSGNGLLIDGASTYVLSGSARGSVRLQYVGSAATPHWCVM